MFYGREEGEGTRVLSCGVVGMGQGWRMEKPKFPLMMLGALAGAILIALAYHWVLGRQICDPGQRGVFGDSFGALNAVVAIVGFAAVAYGLHVKHKDDVASEVRHAADKLLAREQIDAMNAQTQATTTLAAAMNRQLEVSHLVAKYDVAERRMELMLQRVPLQFQGDPTRALIRGMSSPEMKAKRKFLVEDLKGTPDQPQGWCVISKNLLVLR